MGNVVVTVVKYSMLCVYSMSIQPINKLYLFSYTDLKEKSIISTIDLCLAGQPIDFMSLFKDYVHTNTALHCFSKGKCTLLFGNTSSVFSHMFSFNVTLVFIISQCSDLIFSTVFQYHSVNCSLSL